MWPTLLKHARTRGTPSLGPSIPGMKSILGPIQLNGLTIVNSKPFSAPSAVNNHMSVRLVTNEKPNQSIPRKKKKNQLTINQPLNQLLCTCIRPSLFFDWTENAWRHIFFKHIVCRILTQHWKNNIAKSILAPISKAEEQKKGQLIKKVHHHHYLSYN